MLGDGMKKSVKFIAVILIVLSCINFCACKKNTDSLSSQGATANAVDSDIKNQLGNIATDQSVDPENTEIERENGEAVQFEKIATQTSCANGIDVSKWQGKIDWKKVKSAGIDFAIIRIGYRGENGVIYRDDNADYNIQQAQNAGILVGVYFFSTATNVAEAKEEAVWTCTAIKGYKISYPVVYDCEGYKNSDSRMFNLSATTRTDNAIAFLDYIKSAGYTPMIYGAKSDFESTNYWDMSRIEKSYKVWVAHYSHTVYPQKKNPDYNGSYDMWQYTNRGTVDGVEGNCDMAVSYFTATETNPVDSNATPQTATPPKTQAEMIYTDTSDRVTAKDEVNLRDGAGTKYNIVATLKSGEFLNRTGIGTNGWSRLDYNGKTVYAVTSYLSDQVVEVQKPDVVNGQTFTAVNDSVTAKMEVNLRRLPTTDSEMVGTLVSGTFLKRTAKSENGWSRLEYNGQTVYAVTNYLTTEAPQITPSEPESSATSVTEYNMTFTLCSVNVTAKEEVNLRNMPTTDGSSVIYTLKNGEYITKTGVCSQSGWARLDYNGQTVYCIDSFLMQ